MTKQPRKTTSGFSPNHSAIGGPLPSFRALLENGKINRWRVSLGFLLHGLAVAALLLLPLVTLEQLNPQPPETPVGVVTIPRGDPTGDPAVAKPDPGQEPQRPVSEITVPVRVPPNVPTGGDAPFIEATVGPGPWDRIPYGRPDGSPDGMPIPFDVPAAQAPPLRAPAVPEPVRVGGRVRPPRLLRRVEPRYPALARRAGIEGTVVLEALLGIDGRVERITVKSGPPLLVGAAREAVLQWVYEPTYLNDQPVPLILNVVVEFHLRH